MTKFAIPAGLVLAVGLMTGVAFAKPRWTVIHMTKNISPALYPGAECVGTITTDTLPSQKRDVVTWIIRNGNALNDDEVCPMLDKSKVELHFTDDVFGTAVQKVLKAKQITLPNGNSAWGIEGKVDAGIMQGAYKYVVFYKGVKAGPDPEVEVGCPDCGGGGK